MIHSIEQALTLSVPLTLASHHTAQSFYQRHLDPHKATQVYLNTLAVEAVRTYLGWLGIASDLAASDSWDPVIQTLADVADLNIRGQGKLECRPVLPGATTCYIPPETRTACIGYLPVLFDEELTTATLLGFMSSASMIETEAIPLTHLQSIAALLNYLNPQPEQAEKRTHLGKWLEETIASGWQTVEELLGPQLVFNFRSLDLSDALGAPLSVIRAKRLELAFADSGDQSELQVDDSEVANTQSLNRQSFCQVVLVVGITPSDALQSNICVKLAPAKGDRYLPEDLEVRILDDKDTMVMEAQSRQTDMLQLNFRGLLNEQFAIEVALNDVKLVEKFVI